MAGNTNANVSENVNVSVNAVQNNKQRRQFWDLRKTLYRDDPAIVFPLNSIARTQLDVERHPFYQHADRELFLATRNGEPVGRIVAIIDHLQQSHCENKVGFFGFFESFDDQTVVDALLNEAQAWLSERGCDKMRGPVDPSMKAEFGVLVDGNDAPPMIMMAHNMARYRDQLTAAGLEQVREFYAFQFLSKNEPVDQWQRLFESRDKIIKRFPQLSFKEVTSDTFSQTMRDVNELGNRVRSEGWGFVPLTEPELDFMIKNLRRVIRYDMIHVAYWEDKLVGYIVNIPDVNWALQRAKGPFDWVRMLQMPMLLKRCPRTRVIALGVDKEYRTKGIAMLLIARLVERFQEFAEWEFSWVDSENQKSMRAIARTLPLVRSKTYQLFERKI